MRIAGISLGALVVLIALGLLGVRLFINPNHFKGRIEQFVKTSTGRELTLQGTLHLSVFPWIALELGPASLGNPPGFSAEPFVSVRHIALRVKLLPLIGGRLQVGRIEIDGLDLRLEKNAQGQGNWVGLTGAGSAGASQRAHGNSLPALAGLAGIEIRDSRVRYENFVADHVNFNVGKVAPGTPVPVHLTLDLARSRDTKPVTIDAQLIATAAPASERYRLGSVTLKGTWHVKTGGPAVPWKVTVPEAQINLAAQTLVAPAVTVQLASAHLTTDVRATHLLATPTIEDSFRLASFSPRELLTRIGYTPPATRDSRALRNLAASGHLVYQGGAAQISNLKVRLDDSTLHGSARITNVATKADQFDLAIDHINLDGYRASASAPTHPLPKPAQNSSLIPTTFLRGLSANGTLAIGHLTVAGVHLRNVHIGVAANRGLLHIAPEQADLYGGSSSGTMTLDVRGRAPEVTLDQTLRHIDVAQMLQDFAKTRRIAGQGNVTVRLTASGNSSAAMLASLRGRVAADLNNGALEGFNLGLEIERAVALIERHPLPVATNTGRTRFSVFRASADLHHGVATTRDLDIASPSLQVTGGGTTNLVTEAINYRVRARLLNGSAGPGRAALVDVPVVITGSLSKPRVQPDVEALGRSLLRQQLSRHKGEIEKRIFQGLKGLFH